MADRQYSAERGRAQVERALAGLRADGCACPLELRPGHGGLTGSILLGCPVHFPTVPQPLIDGRAPDRIGSRLPNARPYGGAS